MPGTEFRFALSRGLELRLVADGLWNLGWRIEVVSGDKQPDYVWVVSPPYQTAPHLFFGAAYGGTARESAQFERNLRFVLTPEDYERARRIYTDWVEGRTDAAALRDRRRELATGTLRLEITDSSIRERVRVADDVLSMRSTGSSSRAKHVFLDRQSISRGTRCRSLPTPRI